MTDRTGDGRRRRQAERREGVELCGFLFLQNFGVNEIWRGFESEEQSCCRAKTRPRRLTKASGTQSQPVSVLKGGAGGASIQVALAWPTPMMLGEII